MIRKDGIYTFYKIQHFQSDGKWVYSDLGVICSSLDSRIEPYQSFTSVGKCWQETGEHGCYGLATGLLFLKQISRLYPDFKFQLVRAQINQTTTVEAKPREKAKWKVEAKYTTREEYCELDCEDPEDYDIEDFNEVEISVIRENNVHGMKSYGDGGLDKIILFDDDGGYTKENIEWCKKVAETICEILNEKEL